MLRGGVEKCCCGRSRCVLRASSRYVFADVLGGCVWCCGNNTVVHSSQSACRYEQLASGGGVL
jgi:hypothetical protein